MNSQRQAARKNTFDARTIVTPAHRGAPGKVCPKREAVDGNGAHLTQETQAQAQAQLRTRRRETMTDHKTGTRDEWLAARLELLQAEKELTRRSDELARRRQELPWVRIDKEYRFETNEGSASLKDLSGRTAWTGTAARPWGPCRAGQPED
jgi:hypothetical protein